MSKLIIYIRSLSFAKHRLHLRRLKLFIKFYFGLENDFLFRRP